MCHDISRIPKKCFKARIISAIITKNESCYIDLKQADIYTSHLSDVGINVVPGVVWVKAVLVSLHLFPYKSTDVFKVAKNVIVSPRQVPHYGRKGLIQLAGDDTGVTNGTSVTRCIQVTSVSINSLHRDER